jgi:hypothetical protein
MWTICQYANMKISKDYLYELNQNFLIKKSAMRIIFKFAHYLINI